MYDRTENRCWKEFYLTDEMGFTAMVSSMASSSALVDEKN
jgi:hypothetical protein